MVGAIVIIIVATAGMASTTYVQFLKGGLLIIFSLVLVVFCVLNKGLTRSSRTKTITTFVTLSATLESTATFRPSTIRPSRVTAQHVEGEPDVRQARKRRDLEPGGS